MFKIIIKDRNYSSWDIVDANTLSSVSLNISPIENKLFTEDVFSLKNNTVTIDNSPIRSGIPIPGVLILNGNKTYGRETKDRETKDRGTKDRETKETRDRETKKNGKLLYKCIPDNTAIPFFLVPYEIKNMGFSKNFQNIYVVIHFEDWSNKHPMGKLDQVIGPVDTLPNFYEYQLYCKSLHHPIQSLHKNIMKKIKDKSHDELIQAIIEKYPNIEDRTNQQMWDIITIDPLNSVDLDDAFSIKLLPNNVTYQISIYIANVPIWVDFFQLWNSLTKRISTIYLPDKKYPMLPTILSDCLCSLLNNKKRIAFVIDFFIENEAIQNVRYGNALICVKHNYVYEEPKMLKDVSYNRMLEQVTKLSNRYKYSTSITDSHDVIAYLMVMANFYCAKELEKHSTGIFRSTIIKREFIVPNGLPENVSKTLVQWGSNLTGLYVNGEKIANKKHELLDLDSYIHITSPIRRLVDLLNMLKLQTVMGICNFTNDSVGFYQMYANNIEHINGTMKSIKKVQNECSLLHLCDKSPEILTKIYEGYVFQKRIAKDDFYRYTIFLPELNIFSTILWREDLIEFSQHKFQLYLFHNEEKFKRKIRLQIL
jgi:exoribonuclease R